MPTSIKKYLTQDPIFDGIFNKLIDYRDFLAFTNQLNIRDNLIAKILYFGAPRVSEVLTVKVNQLDLKKGTIQFKRCSVQYPPHIREEIKEYIKGKTGDEFVFLTRSGIKVAASYLHHRFDRAWGKIFDKSRITPKMLAEKMELQ